MSTRVLAIPEDHTKDGYILQPIVEQLLRHRGYKNVRLEICCNPRVQGIGQALKREVLELIFQLHPMVNLFLLCVDRDGDEQRRQKLDGLEAWAEGHNKKLLAVNAWQEIEVWVLAGLQDLPSDWDWAEVRKHRDPKEAYFLPHARRRAVANGPGQGRKVLGMEASRNISRVIQLCPEDVAHLSDRLGT